MLRLLSVFAVLLMVLAVHSTFAATRFIETDNETGGDWSNEYGEDGYIFCHVNMNA